MKRLGIWSVVLVTVVMGGCVRAPYMKMTEAWQINNEQVIMQLKEVNENRQYNFPSGYTLANVATAYDQNLFHVFNQHLMSSCLVCRRWVIRDQIKWLKHRDDVLAATAGEYEGGSMGPAEAALKKIELIQERIEYYRAR